MTNCEKLPISVLIPTKNEINNICDCISSVSFADEIIIVDSNSLDGTCEIASELGAKVVQFAWNKSFPKKKNWALEHIEWKHDWVLIIDADERITPALEQELSLAIGTPEYDGYYINRKFMFMGGWLNHCGYYPSWNLRLFKHNFGRYEKIDAGNDTQSGDNEVHEHIILRGKAGYLKHDMLHYAYPSIDVWVEKHNRYSNWEARLLKSSAQQEALRASLLGNELERKRWLKQISQHLPLRPLLRFFYHYVWKKGFLDGYKGWVFCWLLAWYEFVSIAKMNELNGNNDSHGGKIK